VHHPEYVPPHIYKALQGFGWTSTIVDNKHYFSKPNESGYFSWSEALTYELAAGILELHK
jgi:hypothetical protein